jgi:ribosomal protein S18 acetylase RimI-like enzyme
MLESRDNDEVLAEPPAPQGAAAALTSRALAWTYHEPEWMGATEEPWAHGTIYRHPEFPNLSDLNSLRVREATTMTAPELFAFAEDELGRHVHRRIHFDSTAFAAPHREYFAARGFMTFGLTLMHFEGQRPAEPDPAVREVEYDTVAPLGERTLAVFDDGQPIAFAGLDLGDDELEIAGLYVVPEHRGQGLGTALTQSALASAGTEYVWICAEEAGRPKHLYARLGFRPVLTTEMFLRLLPQAD